MVDGMERVNRGREGMGWENEMSSWVTMVMRVRKMRAWMWSFNSTRVERSAVSSWSLVVCAMIGVDLALERLHLVSGVCWFIESAGKLHFLLLGHFSQFAA